MEKKKYYQMIGAKQLDSQLPRMVIGYTAYSMGRQGTP